MEKKINLEKLGVLELRKQELIEIAGGHDGTAYKVGEDLGWAVATFLKIVGLRKVFK